MAWSILREAWLDDRYWLSVEEALLVSCWNGPEVEVYRQVVDAGGTDALELLERGLLPPLEAPGSCERMVLSMDAQQQCGCHFSKLLTDTAWAKFTPTTEEMARASGQSDAGSNETSDTEEATCPARSAAEDPAEVTMSARELLADIT